MHDDRLAERRALLCVVECVLVGSSSDSECLRTDGGTRRLEGLHRRLGLARLASLASTSDLGIELFLAAEQTAPRYANVIEHDFGGVARLDSVLQVLLSLREPLGPRWDDETRLSSTLEFRIDRRHYDVHVGDATVGDPSLRAVQHPLIVCFVVDGTSSQRAHVAPRVGFAYAERSDLHIVGRAVTLGHPLHHLFWGPVAGDTCGSKSRTHDGHADPGITPKDFLDRNRQRQAALVTHRVHDEVQSVQTDLCGFLHDRPGELFALVPLVRCRSDHVNGELMDPIFQLELFVAQGQREFSHASTVVDGPRLFTAERNRRWRRCRASCVQR